MERRENAAGRYKDKDSDLVATRGPQTTMQTLMFWSRWSDDIKYYDVGIKGWIGKSYMLELGFTPEGGCGLNCRCRGV